MIRLVVGQMNFQNIDLSSIAFTNPLANANLWTAPIPPTPTPRVRSDNS